jgi:pimeloyl-ACP methyl ester carboxylesterase
MTERDELVAQLEGADPDGEDVPVLIPDLALLTADDLPDGVRVLPRQRIEPDLRTPALSGVLIAGDESPLIAVMQTSESRSTWFLPVGVEEYCGLLRDAVEQRQRTRQDVQFVQAEVEEQWVHVIYEIPLSESNLREAFEHARSIEAELLEVPEAVAASVEDAVAAAEKRLRGWGADPLESLVDRMRERTADQKGRALEELVSRLLNRSPASARQVECSSWLRLRRCRHSGSSAPADGAPSGRAMSGRLTATSSARDYPIGDRPLTPQVIDAPTRLRAESAARRSDGPSKPSERVQDQLSSRLAAKESRIETGSGPDNDYTRTWSPSGEVDYLELADGTRMRYLKAGSGPTALIMLHTVRTQLDHFQLVIPKLLNAFTVYAVDLPGMGWSDITPGASYTEPALRRALVEFVTTLGITNATLAGESMGATVSLTAATELQDRVREVVAFNPYDYPQGVGRANRVASIYVGSARLPAIGPVVTKMENAPVLGIVLRGGLLDGRKLPDHYLAELRRVGRRPGYARVARAVFDNVDSMIAARELYGRVTAPVTLAYGDHDWSRVPEREANLALLPDAESIALDDTGHFAALEQPARVAEILLANASA